MAHRIFPPCGLDKKAAVPGELSAQDFLLDDYTVNLSSWEPPARGIKLLSGINHTRGTWQGDMVSHDQSGKALAEEILRKMGIGDAPALETDREPADKKENRKFWQRRGR